LFRLGVNACIFHLLDFCFTAGRMMNNSGMCMISLACMTVRWPHQKMILLNLVETLSDLWGNFQLSSET